MEEAPVIPIVDDESLRKATKGLMRAFGFIAETFESATDFLKSDGARRTTFPIVDMKMPDMTGLELYRHLLASGQPIPTILVTAYPDDPIRTRALKAGVICYLSKPFFEDDLLACIRSALEQGEPSGRET